MWMDPTHRSHSLALVAPAGQSAKRLMDRGMCSRSKAPVKQHLPY
jgi:hypothetical protein